jgi:protein TonB
MIQKKTTKGDLENRRTTFLILGIVLVCALTYVGFELYAKHEEKSVTIVEITPDFPDENPVVATDPKTPPPPPETTKQITDIILKAVTKNIDISTTWIVPEYGEGVSVPDYIPIPLIDSQVDLPPARQFAEKMPEYVGGMEEMYKYLAREIQYPEPARVNNIQGVVMVEFIVERDGKISNVRAKSSLYPDCDKEACDKIAKMPKWNPGESMGKPVRCFYEIPVRFSLGR